MTCLEAQSKIMAFIENKLPDDELREFIKHVKTCENCSEELEIYYTLIVGMRQLDENKNLSTNFKKELNDKLDEELDRMTAVKRIATSTIVLILAAIITGLIFVYSGVLDKVYNYEQNAKLKTQTEYYYSDTFGDDLFYNSEYILAYMDDLLSEEADGDITQDSEIEFMNNIKLYNQTHKNYIEIAAEAVSEESEENEENIDN